MLGSTTELVAREVQRIEALFWTGKHSFHQNAELHAAQLGVAHLQHIDPLAVFVAEKLGNQRNFIGRNG
jgi:hypothetical protein